jgi:glucose/arabinose dehydrogenase
LKKIFITVIVSFLLVSVKYSFADYSLTNAFPNLNFSRITEMIPPNDGSDRIFVLTQNGKIYVFPNSASVTSAKVFLDISDRVTQNGSETGLLGMAFHPNYVNNKYFYVDYTTSALPLRTIVARYTVSPTNPDSAIKSSEFVILTVNQPYSNHNGGKIAFGSDHYLYIALGDGGSEGDPNHYGQDRTVLLGKILRINIDSSSGGNNYSIPVTNPFYGNTQGYRQEIYTWGMRNPWRFSFDPVTGRLWCGDVGQNLYEEIDIIQNGKDYGWSIMEGFHCYNPSSGCDTTGLTLPVWEYTHVSGNCSITGGYVYRGPDLPFLTGKYIYADYCSGRVWSLTYDSINPPVNELLLVSGFSISTFGLDKNNALYVCSYSTGSIYKLTGSPIGINMNSETVLTYRLDQNFPNPFNPSTMITYTVPKESLVTIKVYDYLGQEVATLVNGVKNAGQYRLTWNASSYPSGVYFYRMTADGQSIGKKMVLIK